MKKLFVFTTAALTLTGCHSVSSQNNYIAAIHGLQAGVPVLIAGLGNVPAANTDTVHKAETDLTAALAALAASPVPSNADTVLTDLQGLANGLPPGTLSPSQQGEIGAGLALARLVVASLSSSPAL